MRSADVARFAWRSLAGYRTRTLLMMLAMSIGVGAVVVLTALGDGARTYVRHQFAALGTNTIAVLPGRAETFGGSSGVVIGRTPRDLTLDDALALLRIPSVRRVAPLNLGAGEVWWKGRLREVPVLGSTAAQMHIRHLTMAQGRFLPEEDPRKAMPVCVIGSRVSKELFGGQSPLGEWVRVGDRRFRVIGVLAQGGVSLGLDIDEVVIIPIASAQALFNQASLLRILVEARSREELESTADAVRRVLADRHDGERDVTVVTQDAVVAAFDRILVALTLAVAGIASISLVVAGILVMNVMLIAVSQRTAEIGLLKAIGASPAQVRLLFFAEAAVLCVLSGLAGLLLGEFGSFAIRQAYPALPAFPPPWAIAAALVTSTVTGILFTLAPARRAARLQPALALARR